MTADPRCPSLRGCRADLALQQRDRTGTTSWIHWPDVRVDACPKDEQRLVASVYFGSVQPLTPPSSSPPSTTRRRPMRRILTGICRECLETNPWTETSPYSTSSIVRADAKRLPPLTPSPRPSATAPRSALTLTSTAPTPRPDPLAGARRPVLGIENERLDVASLRVPRRTAAAGIDVLLRFPFAPSQFPSPAVAVARSASADLTLPPKSRPIPPPQEQDLSPLALSKPVQRLGRSPPAGPTLMKGPPPDPLAPRRPGAEGGSASRSRTRERHMHSRRPHVLKRTTKPSGLLRERTADPL